MLQKPYKYICIHIITLFFPVKPFPLFFQIPSGVNDQYVWQSRALCILPLIFSHHHTRK